MLKVWMKPLNIEERIIWYYLLLVYPVYFIGGLFVFGPLLAWVLFALVIKRWWGGERISVSLITWSWIVGGVVLATSYFVGLVNHDYSIFKVATTLAFDWGKGYALIPLFLLAGNALHIRKELISRAVCLLAIQSLAWFPLFAASRLAGFQGFVSPLKALGRGGDIFYGVLRSPVGIEVQELRLSMFAPWAPALGVIFTVFFFVAQQEKVRPIKFIGMFACAFLVLSSVSRLGIVALPIAVYLVWLIGNIKRPLIQVTGALGLGFSGILLPNLIQQAKDFKDRLDSYRSSSSMVRERITTIGMRLWRDEAPIWGHGVQKSGPAIAHNMPIGTHHTWIALLYVNGLVGFLSICLPYLISLGYFIFKFEPAALGILLGLGFYSFGENWDSMAYLIWPALVYIGLTLKEVVNDTAEIEITKLTQIKT